MISPRFFRASHLRGSLLAFVASTGLGCILAIGSEDDSGRPNSNDECSPAGSHSHWDPQNYCVCDPGYGWCTVDDPNGAHNCCPLQDTGTGDDSTGDQSMACASGSNNFVGADGNCYCASGFDWCSSDINDLNCCALEENGDTSLHPDATCLPSEEGWDWCSHTSAMGVEGSTYYVCLSGKWVKSPDLADQGCRDQDFDFAYGCVFDEASNKNQLQCGKGPGTACSAQSPDTCSEDRTSLTTCIYGRLTSQSCVLADNASCTTPTGMTSDLQLCELQGAKAACVCQDDSDSSDSGSSDSTSTSDSSSDTGSTSDSSTSTSDTTSDSDTSTDTSSASETDDTTSDTSATDDTTTTQ